MSSRPRLSGQTSFARRRNAILCLPLLAMQMPMLCNETHIAETGSLCSLGSLCCPPLPLPPLCPPPRWFCCPPSSFDPVPAPSGPPIVSCAVANRLERSICVRIVLARYDTARTSWMWLLLEIVLVLFKVLYRWEHTSLFRYLLVRPSEPTPAH
jgi:hypothetical protein